MTITYLGAYLVTALAGLQMYDFPHDDDAVAVAIAVASIKSYEFSYLVFSGSVFETVFESFCGGCWSPGLLFCFWTSDETRSTPKNGPSSDSAHITHRRRRGA